MNKKCTPERKRAMHSLLTPFRSWGGNNFCLPQYFNLKNASVPALTPIIQFLHISRWINKSLQCRCERSSSEAALLLPVHFACIPNEREFALPFFSLTCARRGPTFSKVLYIASILNDRSEREKTRSRCDISNSKYYVMRFLY